MISSTCNLSLCQNLKQNNGNIELTAEQKNAIKQQAKNFENRLAILGQDNFIKQHEQARQEEIGIYTAAQYTLADYNPQKDYKFGTPKKRYFYLLSKAKKYQSDEAINNFTKDVEMQHEKHIDDLKNKIYDLNKQLSETQNELDNSIKNKIDMVREETVKWMNTKLKDLNLFFKESQEISSEHKRLKEKLKNGELS